VALAEDGCATRGIGAVLRVPLTLGQGRGWTKLDGFPGVLHLTHTFTITCVVFSGVDGGGCPKSQVQGPKLGKEAIPEKFLTLNDLESP